MPRERRTEEQRQFDQAIKEMLLARVADVARVAPSHLGE
jgi:hypothetical protein